ncbi:MAG: ribose 5-phosphate isomerase A [Phycisphaerales bacterium]|nr:ribose 5-phosphate isomerase A [Phycisphaerales bacterium]
MQGQATQASDALAHEAVAPIRSGMVVGLGTGRAAARGIKALAGRVEQEQLDVRCVATSRASHELAVALGLQLKDLGDVGRLDYLFDGADEFDDGLRMLKGGGGAMTQERIAARASGRCVYMVQAEKRVSRLGERCKLGVEVLPTARASAMAVLSRHGLHAQVRQQESGAEFITDNGNIVLDAPLPAIELEPLAHCLDATPGVVGHGLFLGEADVILIEDGQGHVDRLVRDGLGDHKPSC